MPIDTADRSPPVWVWGLPLTPLTMAQTLDLVDQLVADGKPNFFITANLHYAMLTAQDVRLPPLNQQAAFILADGMPLVWASRWRPNRLPERVAGSDLVPAMCERAAAKGHRIFLLGGAPGIADEAARNLCARYPQLQIAGIEVPPFRELSADEHAALVGRIRAAGTQLLFVAFGQPKGELWLARHCQELGVPAAVQIGATFDFLAGRVRRSPRWLQRIGMEWAYRLYLEPTRLLGRYTRNALFVGRMLVSDVLGLFRRRDAAPPTPGPRNG